MRGVWEWAEWRFVFTALTTVCLDGGPSGVFFWGEEGNSFAVEGDWLLLCITLKEVDAIASMVYLRVSSTRNLPSGVTMRCAMASSMDVWIVADFEMLSSKEAGRESLASS